MASSLLNSIGFNNNSGINNFLSHLNEFNNFKNSFQGDPRQQGELLLKSGKMTQDQFQQYAQLANLIRPLIGR